MTTLNLARKWRPKTFEQIIGQDLSVSMLKNSLYLKKLFPVYLFSGQRGCGKTSSARIFAAALNCKKLPDFQADAKNHTIPCLQCDSCHAMLEADHPDFIEMDAASHTGVDSVRQIIESCAYMPLAGSKKIYLIDEAHMLSKAAFNAFLKILEEPPHSAIFILATTEIQKIPETVRSRCFQVLFNPVEKKVLHKHLLAICHHESIAIDDEALNLLVDETDGSVRDAVNAIEQIRFTGEQITKTLVLKSLGKISDTQLATLLDCVMEHNPRGLLEHLTTMQFESLSAQNMWNMIVAFLRSLLWVKYGVAHTSFSYSQNYQTLIKLAEKCSINRLHALLQILWSQESLFLQTPQKHLFLETVLLQMCEQVNLDDLKTLLTQYTIAKQPEVTPPVASSKPSTSTSPSWETFVKKLEQTSNDPLILSIFKQAHFKGIDATKTKLLLQLANQSPFLIEKITESEPLWKSLLIETFPGFVSFEFITPPLEKTTQKKTLPPPNNPHPRPFPTGGPQKQSFGPTVDISDEEKWPKASLLTKHFSGRLEKIPENKEKP